MEYDITGRVASIKPDGIAKWNGLGPLSGANYNAEETATLTAVHLAIDPKRIELWEIEVLESGNLGNSLLVLARYLVDSDGRTISPELSALPLDELPKGEVARIKNSAAYKRLRRFSVAQLEGATQQIKNAGAGF